MLFSVIVCALGLMMLSHAKAQGKQKSTATNSASTTWRVIINVQDLAPSKPRYTPLYDVVCSQDNIHFNACTGSPDAENLKIQKGDTVQWIVKSNLDTHATMSYDLLVYSQEPILDDEYGEPTWRFGMKGDGTTPTAGGTSDRHAGRGVQHEYCIAVYDHTNGRLYADDPKMLIASETGLNGLVKAQDAFREQAQSLVNSPDAKLKKEVKEDLEDFLKAVQKIEERLDMR